MQPPFVSLVIAAYCDCNKLRSSIESVLVQGEGQIELIIVDGGSLDGTPELLESYGSRINSWISEPDNGIYDAWNKGFSMATAEWIAFLGADDVLLPGWFLAYKEYLSRNPGLDYVSSAVRLVSSNSSVRVVGSKWSWRVFRRYMNVAHVGSFHSRRLFTEYGLFNHKLQISGDYEFLLRPRSSLKAGYIDDVLVDMAAGGISNSSPSSLWETFTIKWNLRSVSRIIAIFDLIEASTKWSARLLLKYCCANVQRFYFPK